MYLARTRIEKISDELVLDDAGEAAASHSEPRFASGVVSNRTPGLLEMR